MNSLTVRSVKKAVDVLLAVAESDRPLTLTEAAIAAGIPVPTARRLLVTLAESSLVKREGNRYRLGVRAYELGKRAERALGLIGASRPHLRRLADAVGENANLAVLDGTEVVYLVCEECSRMVRAFTVQGARVPAHATGVGKALLSGLSDEEIAGLYPQERLQQFTAKTISTVQELLAEVRQARDLGYAADEGEREEGVYCLAAPVRDHRGQIVAAVSVSGPSSRLAKSRNQVRSMVLECARQISTDLGWNNNRRSQDI